MENNELLSHVGDKVQDDLMQIGWHLHHTYRYFCFVSGSLAKNNDLTKVLNDVQFGEGHFLGERDVLRVRQKEYSVIKKESRRCLSLLSNLKSYLSLLLHNCGLGETEKDGYLEELPDSYLVSPSYIQTIENMYQNFQIMIQKFSSLFESVLLCCSDLLTRDEEGFRTKSSAEESLNIVQGIYCEDPEEMMFMIYNDQTRFQETLLLLDHLKALKREVHLRWLQGTKKIIGKS